jgi:hypothetical protein
MAQWLNQCADKLSLLQAPGSTAFNHQNATSSAGEQNLEYELTVYLVLMSPHAIPNGKCSFSNSA